MAAGQVANEDERAFWSFYAKAGWCWVWLNELMMGSLVDVSYARHSDVESSVVLVAGTGVSKLTKPISTRHELSGLNVGVVIGCPLG